MDGLPEEEGGVADSSLWETFEGALQGVVEDQCRMATVVAQSGNAFPMRIVYIPKVEGERSWIIQRPAPDPHSLLDGLRSTWPHRVEFQTFTACMQSNPLLFQEQFVPGDVKEQAKYVLERFLYDYFTEATPYHPNYWQSDVFRRLVSRFKESITTGHYTVHIWIPLYGALVEGDVPWTLDSNTEVVSIDQVQQWDHIGSPPSSSRIPDWWQQRHWIHARETLARRDPATVPPIPDRVHHWVRAMRLIGGGDVRLLDAFWQSIPGDLCPVGIPFTSRAMENRRTGRPTVVSATERQAIQAYARQFPALQDQFHIAVERWQATAEHWTPEDQLIDAVIALESLLLPTQPQELRFKFALRGAWVLGQSTQARREWYQRLMAVYDARSTVVHGSKPNTKSRKEDPRHLHQVAEDAVRAILRRILDGNFNAERWKRFLDDVVLSGATGEDLPGHE